MIGTGALGLALAVAIPCEEAAAGGARPNVVLAIADDWGWPHAGAYGDPAARTPAFDALAQAGVLFEQAFVSSPSCTPSRGALLTGQHFFRLGAGANLWCSWPEGEDEAYPELVAAAGYHVGSWRKAWGPGRGGPGGTAYPSVDAFFAARAEGQPFCLWLGSSDPHRPYEAGCGARGGFDPADVALFPHFPDAPEVRSDVADYLFEVARFDRDVGELVARLAASGELANTLFVVTGDHGMPFPRGKGNVYDAGARVPLVVSWPARVPPGRRVTDLVSLVDLAPTFLEAAGVPVPEAMTGRSLLALLESGRGGRVEAARDHVVLGRERHVPCQEAPEREGYPVRALRTDDHLYVRNLRPDRWPGGTPHHERCVSRGSWLGDCDDGPTKRYLWERRGEDAVAPLYDLCFAKRPAEELYDLAADPGQVRNLAGAPEHEAVRARLAAQLDAQLARLADPRATGDGAVLEGHPYLGGGGGKWPYAGTAQDLAGLQGVLVGEARATSVLLQTRLTAATLGADGDAPGREGWVAFDVSDDPAFPADATRRVGPARATAATDCVVRIAVEGLAPGTRHHWRVLRGLVPDALLAGERGSFRTPLVSPSDREDRPLQRSERQR